MARFRFDKRWHGTCANCERESLRICQFTDPDFIWCPDCMQGWYLDNDDDFTDLEGRNGFEQQKKAIMNHRQAMSKRKV